jgi:hypothetical protein
MLVVALGIAMAFGLLTEPDHHESARVAVSITAVIAVPLVLMYDFVFSTRDVGWADVASVAFAVVAIETEAQKLEPAFSEAGRGWGYFLGLLLLLAAGAAVEKGLQNGRLKMEVLPII